MLPKTKPIINKEIFKDIDRKRCLLCNSGIQPISAHHIVPRSHIRLDIVENIAALCEVRKDGSMGCHPRMKTPECKEYTKRILSKKGDEAVAILKSLAPTWSYWSYSEDTNDPGCDKGS